MPIFEYVCKKCEYQFEALVYGKQKAACPKCHGGQLVGACGSCGDPRGPGSCRRPDLN